MSELLAILFMMIGLGAEMILLTDYNLSKKLIINLIFTFTMTFVFNLLFDFKDKSLFIWTGLAIMLYTVLFHFLLKLEKSNPYLGLVIFLIILSAFMFIIMLGVKYGY